MQKLSHSADWPLYATPDLRVLESTLQAQSPQPLMHRAGLAAAHLALALAPHARRIWVAAGPGNNGGDGLEAALHLRHWGHDVRVSLMQGHTPTPADAQASLHRARQAGVPITTDLPLPWLRDMDSRDLCIDALLGIGASRPLSPALRKWVQTLNQSPAPVLALDVPTGLNPESGQWLGCEDADALAVQADHTLSFIAVKAGLFMGHGRDACGQIWLEPLGHTHTQGSPLLQAQLNGCHTQHTPLHASHKGSHGDVAVIGGEAMAARGMGMTGAAMLAATSALHAGAGRVLLSLLSAQACDSAAPDLMQCDWRQLALEKLHVVCGCGGGMSVREALPAVLQQAAHLVLDADGLNAVAQDPGLQAALRARAGERPTVITPHPLEAARLLGSTTAAVQSQRLQAAQRLAERFQCTVVLKGSGSVLAAPGQTPRINTSGNGLLATGGTGDVLAGLIGARMAQGLGAWPAACSAVAQHGQAANDWPVGQALTANRLARRWR